MKLGLLIVVVAAAAVWSASGQPPAECAHQAFFNCTEYLGLVNYTQDCCDNCLTPEEFEAGLACTKDCNDVWGGLDYDSCLDDDCADGEEKDCAGVCNGYAVYDVCNVCNGDGDTCNDCAGFPAGPHEVDCHNVCQIGGPELDVCGVCGGDGSTCANCPYELIDSCYGCKWEDRDDCDINKDGSGDVSDILLLRTYIMSGGGTYNEACVTPTS